MWANNMFSLEENTHFFTPRNTNTYSYNKPSSINTCKPWVPPSSSYSVQPSPPPPHHGVTTFQSSATWQSYFEATKVTNQLIVVEFTATWCGACRKMEQTMDEFASKYIDVNFAKIDVDKLFDVSCEYNVQTIPTFLLIKRGKMVDKISGARKEELRRKIENNAP